MEIVDNAMLLVVPGAMDGGLASGLFWGSLAFALAVAFVLTVPVNYWLISRGRGHAAVHEMHGHEQPDTRCTRTTAIGAIFTGLSRLSQPPIRVLPGIRIAKDPPHIV